VAGIVLVAAVVAVVASGGSRDDADTASGVEQTRAVQVTGAALPPMSGGTDGAVGTTVPELRGASFDGAPVSITHDGRAKLIVFVAHWCPHCQAEIPLLVDHLRSHPMPLNVDLVTVATSTTPDRPNYPPSAWLSRENWTGPTLADSADGTAAQAFGLASFPYFVAIDGTGKLVTRTSGEIPVTQFDQIIDTLARG
jgi:thiol-disulfide isomerase/thioredoxin